MKKYYPGQQPRKVRFVCMDESRFGLKGIRRRRITLRGVKPIGRYVWRFEYFWLYGAVEPVSGESFYWHYSHLDHECFEHYLRKLSEEYKESLLVVLLDNSGVHKVEDLEIPENVVLLFQPPYSPELNPIERVWQHLKSQLGWEMFEQVEALQERVGELVRSISPEVIKSLTGYPWLLHSLYRAGI